MNTEAINIKIDPKTKKAAQRVAEDLGFSLSSLVKAYLRDLIKTKTIHFSRAEEPSEYLIQMLKKSEEDVKAGRIIEFLDPKDAIRHAKKMIADDEKASR